MRFAVTTSWDDGHPLDLRLADLLEKHSLPGCFYVPRHNPERAVLAPREVRRLGERFEIGGHTLHHVRLTTISTKEARTEIQGCRDWLSDTVGGQVDSFCYPGGAYRHEHTREVARAGFSVGRSADWMCLDPGSPLQTTPSLQFHAHPRAVHVAHCLRRQHVGELVRYARRYRFSRDPLALAERMIEEGMRRGGVFHVWGHSWEIDRNAAWPALEELFAMLSALPGDVSRIENRALATWPHPTSEQVFSQRP